MENFVAKSSAKLYDTEERVRQLERCECRLGCRWTSGSPDQPETQLRADGESWRDNQCDVCSCHRGQVSCRHVTCPSSNCSDPHHVAGKCCPVCYKPCAYKTQTVRHGNKLVINSSSATCKECVCLDGQFKCQRVQPMTGDAGGRLRRHSLSSVERLLNQQDQDETGAEAEVKEEISPALEQDGDEYADDFDSLDRADCRLSRSKRSGPLICPPIECPAERQVRLNNDCCTYCYDTNFCTLPGASERCHPDAICTSKTTANLSATSTFDDTFTCICKPGFTGDARLACHDIDECAAEPSLCNLNSTDCLNKAGSFECTCKSGFKRPEEADPRAPCVDVDECADGKLNRCHPQALCINEAGSYRCQCKRGYLGNGFECHKWFSTTSNVASYFHAHRKTGHLDGAEVPSEPFGFSGDDDTEIADDNSLMQEASAEQQADKSSRVKHQLQKHKQQTSTQHRQQSSYATTNNQLAPSANIKRVASLHSYLGSNEDRSQPMLAGQASKKETSLMNTSSATLLGHSAKLQDPVDPLVDLPVALALNTRTMFFQPPPRPKKPQQPSLDNVTQGSLQLTGSGQQQDLNAPPPASSYSNSRQQQPLASVLVSAPGDTNRDKTLINGTLHKKGTIIASATTSQNIKGHGTSRLGYTSSRQHKSLRSSDSLSIRLEQDWILRTLLIAISMRLVLCLDFPGI